MAGYGQQLVLGWSAYTRYLAARARGTGDGRLSSAQLTRFDEAVLAGELFVCPPFRMEALYSAQNAAEAKEMSRALDFLPQATASAATFHYAMEAQQALAEAKAVSHRVKLPDLLVAAVAHDNELGVLHYDKDYDTIAKHSGLECASVWIAKRGSID